MEKIQKPESIFYPPQLLESSSSVFNRANKIITELKSELSSLKKENEELKISHNENKDFIDEQDEVILKQQNNINELNEQLKKYKDLADRIVNFKQQDLDVYQIQSLSKEIISNSTDKTESKEAEKQNLCNCDKCRNLR